MFSASKSLLKQTRSILARIRCFYLTGYAYWALIIIYLDIALHEFEEKRFLASLVPLAPVALYYVKEVKLLVTLNSIQHSRPEV